MSVIFLLLTETLFGRVLCSCQWCQLVQVEKALLH